MTPPPEEKKKQKKRMPKTVRPKSVVINDKAYYKCPYPDCGHMVRDWGYNSKSGLRSEMLYTSDPNANIYEHIKKVHELVWLRTGKRAGWWRLSKFYSREQVEKWQSQQKGEENHK